MSGRNDWRPPQLFFHSIIVKSKEYGIKKKQALNNNFSIHSTQSGASEENINTKIYNLLGLICLSLYRIYTNFDASAKVS